MFGQHAEWKDCRGHSVFDILLAMLNGLDLLQILALLLQIRKSVNIYT